MSVAFVPGFLWTMGDERALAQAGLGVDIVPLTALAGDVLDVERDLVAALAARIDSADVAVGYSMGARVLLAALSRGLRVRAAVLLSLSGTPPAERAARARADAERAAWLVRDRASFVDAWAALPLFVDAADHPQWRAQQARRRALDPADAVAHAATLARFSSGTLTYGPLGDVDVPIVLCAGARDAAAVALARTTAAALPHARVELVAGCGHALPLLAADDVVRIARGVIATTTDVRSPSPRSSDAAPARS
jgi:hypothetical protein